LKKYEDKPVVFVGVIQQNSSMNWTQKTEQAVAIISWLFLKNIRFH